MTTKQIIDTIYKLEFISFVKNGIEPSIEIVGSGQVSSVYLDHGKIYIIGEEKDVTSSFVMGYRKAVADLNEKNKKDEEV